MDEFYIKLADILEVDAVQPDDVLADFETWDSLTVLSVIAIIDEYYGVNLISEDLKGVNTVKDLANLIVSQKGG
ncbi:MAG: acyl carrier protein [Smithella sp.]|jgi:acyl carrier protein